MPLILVVFNDNQFNFIHRIIRAIALRITVRTFLNSQTLSLLTVPCSLFPVPLRVAL